MGCALSGTAVDRSCDGPSEKDLVPGTHVCSHGDAVWFPWIPLQKEVWHGAMYSHVDERENCLSRKVTAAWHCVSGYGCEGEVAELLALMEKKDQIWTSSAELPRQLWTAGDCTYNSFVRKNLMSSKIKPKINEDVFPAIEEEKSTASFFLLFLWNA